MKLLALCSLVVAACVPNATGAGCSPLSCATSQVLLAHGSLLGVRSTVTGPLRVIDLQNGATRRTLPTGVIGANLLVHQKGAAVTWFNASTGLRVARKVVRAPERVALTGASQDGTRAVLVSRQKRTTAFLIASRAGQRRVVLPKNNWGFDALSGTKLYLLENKSNGYVVRLYDLATNTLVAQPLKDQEEAALISGVPWTRQPSADGRYLFTLYISSGGAAMVHQLDVRAGVAKCIDLPGSGDFNSGTTYSLTMSGDGRTLWAVSTGYGKVVAIDVASSRARLTFDFPGAEPGRPSTAAAALSPDGERLAVASGPRLWFVGLAERRADLQQRTATALGFAPDGRSLWALGPEGRVTAVPVPGIR